MDIRGRVAFAAELMGNCNFQRADSRDSAFRYTFRQSILLFVVRDHFTSRITIDVFDSGARIRSTTSALATVSLYTRDYNHDDENDAAP